MLVGSSTALDLSPLWPSEFDRRLLTNGLPGLEKLEFRAVL
jgi:hypothetical protein